MSTAVMATPRRTEWSTWDVPAGFAHVRLARTQIRQLVEQFGDEVADSVEVAVNEVMANVVCHTSTPVMTVRVRDTGTAVRVECWDDGSPSTDRSGRSANPLEEYGKGLTLVRSMTSRYGHFISPGGGRTVWFEVDHTT